MVDVRISMTRPDIERAQVQLKCPKCGSVNSITLGQVRRQEIIVCSGCGAKIKLDDKDGSVGRSLNNIDRALDGLEETIRRFGR